MNLHEEQGLRIAAQGVLALIGLVLLGTGLALLSGLAHSGAPRATVALVIVQPLPTQPPRPATVSRPTATVPSVPPGARPEPSRRVIAPGPAIAPRAPEPPPPAGRRPADPAELAWLAIVIDDIGHNVRSTARFLALDYPLTFSVLPGVPYTRESAALIRRAGREYIVHLPMQPFDFPREDPGPNALLLTMDRETTAERVRGYLHELPDAIGASNHMGSAYTNDLDRMEVVQTVLAEHRLFFLNSRTSDAKAPRRIARQWGYEYLERDVFLDHDLAEAAIERAFQQAVRQARRAGRAVAIGHPHAQTLRVLRRNLPGLEAHGVRAVPLSALLEQHGPATARTP